MYNEHDYGYDGYDYGYYGTEEHTEHEDGEWANHGDADDDIGEIDPETDAHVDEEGNFYATQEVVDEVDKQNGVMILNIFKQL